MELHHPSCVLSSNAPALPEPDTSIPSRVLQERSANRCHDYPENSSAWKRSSSPTENAYSGRLGGYLAGNVANHLNGEKTEDQIEYELKRLLNLLRRCEKYQKYRDRQPQTAKEREQRWPDHLEEAFFRGLIRWPPMGRRKHMLDGQLRGRNELVADSIMRDTGEPRTRKQVSSHIQVLKNILAHQPQILVYMSTEDMGGRRNRHNSSHYGHLRSRHHSSHSKYDYSQGGSSAYQGYGLLPSSLALAKIQSGHDDAPYTVADFGMFVEVSKRRVHDFTQLTSNSRLSDLNVTDTTSWHKQYPEFNFHRTDELQHRHVLVCDASMRVMTMDRPAEAELSITFDLRSQVDLACYSSLETRTRFFENGKPADQMDNQGRRAKMTRTHAEYYPEHGRLVRVKFGSRFWASQMQKLGNALRKAGDEEQGQRVRCEGLVRRELQGLTAAQDLYGVGADGEERCLLTVLWRFNMTRGWNEPGRVQWRIVDFGGRGDRWVKEETTEDKTLNLKGMMPVATAPASLPTPTSVTSSIYPTLPLDFHNNNPFGQHPPPLDLDTLALEGITTDFSNPNSGSAPSLATDYSQPHSLPSIAQSHDFPDTNEFDFNGGHITISGCLEPAINLGAYDAYGGTAHSHAQGMAGSLQSIAGLDPDAHQTDTFHDFGLGVATNLSNCYATKPNWHHANLISHLETAAEQYNDLLVASTSGHPGDAIVGGGVLHDGQPNNGLWKLQAAFGEDTGVGADHRKDSMVEQRGDERYRGY